MGTTTHTLLLCAHFAPEAKCLAAVLQAEGVTVATFDGRCGRPGMTWEALGALAGSAGDAVNLHIIGGCCLPDPASRPPGFPPATFTRLGQCFELLADPSLVRSLTRDQYVVTPGWLVGWRAKIAQWGFDQATARAFFAEAASGIVLLDTGSVPACAAFLQDFGAFVGLPVQSETVGIEPFRRNILAHLGKPVVAADQPAPEGAALADYAMALDLLGPLGAAENLEAAVEEIAEVFRQLTAARAVRVLYEKEGRGETLYPALPAGADRERVCARLRRAATPIEALAKGSGFCLPIVHQGQRLATIEVDEIPARHHLPHYMNFALAIAKVCLLGLLNAGRFEKIQAAQAALEDANALLIQKLAELQQARQEIYTLKGILPICMHCKKIRDDRDAWHQLEEYISQASEAQFSHGICPDCLRTFYPECT